MSEKRRAPEPDLVECECGITFTALRCPGLDCQKIQPGISLCTDAERAILAEIDEMFTRSPQWFENHLPTGACRDAP